MTYERPNIARMQGYTPGEQPVETGVIKLNTNENPYPPAPQIAKELAAIDTADLRRYPSPTAETFRRVAAELHELQPDNVIATNGGDEFLRLVLTTFVDPTETVAIMRPSYSLYPVLAQVQNCRLLQIELEADWSLPADLAQQLNSAQVKLCILVNPHAPSGRLENVGPLARLAQEFSGLLLLDEAYVDFIDPKLAYSTPPLLTRLDNLLILRTLSKGYSLAGLRFGYGLASSQLIAPMLFKTRDSYNTDLLSQRLATAALANQDYAGTTWARVRTSRGRLQTELEKLGMQVFPGQANFLLCRVPEGTDAATLQQALKSRQVLVRHFDQDRLSDKLRITVGSEAENDALLKALETVLHG